MHLNHSNGITLAIREEHGPQMIDFIGNREVAGCELLECGRQRARGRHSRKRDRVLGQRI